MPARLSAFCRILVLSACTAPAFAQSFTSPAQRVAVLELYTSEGCSSCPPADRWFSALADDPRLWRTLVPLAFHVDYWNSLGWRDRFSDARFSARQSDYVHARGLSQAYTPGMLLDGREWRGWLNGSDLALRQLPAPAAAGRLQLDVDGEQVHARFAPAVAGGEALELHLVRLGFGLSTAVGGGENGGRQLHHDFVVSGWQQVPLRAVDGGWQADLKLPPAAAGARREAVAAWVARAGEPRPLQATGGWLTP